MRAALTESGKLIGYLAPEGREDDLIKELNLKPSDFESFGRLIVTKNTGRPLPAWAQNIWLQLRREKISSIGEAAKLLKSLQRNWALYPVAHFRRAQLIQGELPKIKTKALEFPAELPKAPLGSWTLIDTQEILFSTECTSAFANGELKFADPPASAGPPSLAYLKVWEALTLIGRWPKPHERCLDLGSCPGGWTWALARLGAEVLSVDKAMLDVRVEAMPGVEFLKKDVFKLDPSSVGRVDWLFCDVICYPDKLFELMSAWIKVHPRANFVCTLKFQGETDFDSMKKFRALPYSTLRHLHHNKHELTWIRLPE